MSDVVSWAGLFFLGSAVVDGERGSSGGVQVFCAPGMCGVGEPWNKLSYLLVLCLRGLDAACTTFVCSTQNKQWVVGILSVFLDTEVLELCFITDTDVCRPLWVIVDCVLSLLCIVALGLVLHFVCVGWSSWCGCCLVATSLPWSQETQLIVLIVLRFVLVLSSHLCPGCPSGFSSCPSSFLSSVQGSMPPNCAIISCYLLSVCYRAPNTERTDMLRTLVHTLASVCCMCCAKAAVQFVDVIEILILCFLLFG
jgi:hypothetical protein